MKTTLSTTLKYLPLGLGILILTISALFAPWHEVTPYLKRLTVIDGLIITALGTAFYFSRIIRYRYMIKVLGESMGFRQLVTAYFVSQPISLLPAGEMYRSVMLKKHGNIPLVSGIPIVFIQSLTEKIGLVLIALVGSIILHKYVAIVLLVAVLYAALIITLQYRKSGRKRHKLVNMIPFVKVSRRKMLSFFKQNHVLLSGWSFVVLLLSSFVSSIIAITALFVAAQAMDIKLSIIESGIAYALPTILQNLTFLPGGIGVNEQGSVGILLLFGEALPAAIAITLVVRFITLGLGVILGVLAIIFDRS